MNRLVCFTLLYGLLFKGCERLSEAPGAYPLLGCAGLLLYLSAAVRLLRREGRARACGLCPVRDRRRAVRLAAPLLLLPLCNRLLAAGEAPSAFGSAEAALMTCLSVFAEELLFRGVLPGLLEQRYALREQAAALISGAVFAALHFSCVPGGASLPAACLQAAVAFGTGVALCALTAETGSLLPGTLIHLSVNLTAAETAAVTKTVPSGARLLWPAVSVLLLGYGLRLCREREKKGNQSHEAVH